MRTRTLLPVVLLVAAAAPPAAAVDAPHDASFTTGDCTECHALHNATGAGLINQPTNFALCASCHDASATGARLGYPWGTADQATPGSGGAHHHWDSLANNPTYGATPPAPTSEMGKRVRNGYLQCSTCHDQHAASPAFGGVQHTSYPPGVPQTHLAGGTGACQLALLQPTAAAAPRGYLVDVVLAGAVGTARFRFSNDGGRSWFVGPGVPYTTPASAALTSATSNTLNDGANVTVRWSGGACAVGDQWKFYVSYPFLRVSNVNSAMCETCHASRVMNHVAVEGPGNGVTVFSHPVGVTLNVNAKGYDRAANALLDANGALQSTGDGNPTNDLLLASDGTVRCLSCHYPHNADSNSLTVDPR